MSSDAEQLSMLADKMSGDITAGNLYEALQFVQSFIARKKKGLTSNMISQLVFKGAELLSGTGGSSVYAGTLIEWYINGGGGTTFEIVTNHDEKYNDCIRFERLLKKLDSNESEKVLDPVYKLIQPKMIDIYNNDSTSSGDKEAITSLTKVFTNSFLSGKNWYAAFSSAISIADYKNAVLVCDQWSASGYVSEGILFFSRACLHAMGEAGALCGIGFQREAIRQGYVKKHLDNATPATAATWHLCEMIAELYALKDMDKGEKRKIFAFLSDKYKPLLNSVDSKFVNIFDKAGNKLFRSTARANPQAHYDPLKIFSSMMGGGDMSQMMQNMAKMR